jgi:hypothetical protein
VIALLLALALWQAPQQRAAPADTAQPRLQMGVAVRPETVTVGEHYLVSVRVRAPRGAAISFPVGPDSGHSVEAVDPRVITSAPETTVVDRTATYRLVAWDTGGQAAHLGSLVVTVNGVDRRIPITGDRVHVRSVLPADTSMQVPKPARDVIAAPRPWWYWLVAALVAAALLGLLIWWWRRRRGRVQAVPLDPMEDAQRAFARIDALGLLEAGERGRYVALNVEVLRDYLARRIPEALRSLTSTELLAAVRARREIPLQRLAPLLTETDLIKFARRPVTTDRARELAGEARAVVTGVEQAIQAIEAERAKAAERAA